MKDEFIPKFIPMAPGKGSRGQGQGRESRRRAHSCQDGSGCQALSQTLCALGCPCPMEKEVLPALGPWIPGETAGVGLKIGLRKVL